MEKTNSPSKVFYTKAEIKANEKEGEQLFDTMLSQRKYPNPRFDSQGKGLQSNSYGLNKAILSSTYIEADYKCHELFEKGTGKHASCKKGVKKSYQKYYKQLYNEHTEASKAKYNEFMKWSDSRK